MFTVQNVVCVAVFVEIAIMELHEPKLKLRTSCIRFISSSFLFFSTN